MCKIVPQLRKLINEVRKRWRNQAKRQAELNLPLKAWATEERRPLRDECIAQQRIEFLVDQRVSADCQSERVGRVADKGRQLLVERLRHLSSASHRPIRGVRHRARARLPRTARRGGF